MPDRDDEKRWLPKLSLGFLLAATIGGWGFLAGYANLFPGNLVRPFADEIRAFLKGGEGEEKSVRQRLQMHPQEDARTREGDGFVLLDPGFTDPGYLLLSRFSGEHDQSIVELIRLADFSVMHTWIPPIEALVEDSPIRTENNTVTRHRVRHPYLLEDGSILFTPGMGPLARVSRDNEVIWRIDAFFHHSIERGPDGDFYVPLAHDPSTLPISLEVRDDGWARVSPDGKILRRWSLGRIFLDNGEVGLLLGVAPIAADTFHLNDVQPLMHDSADGNTGDVVLSARNISTVLLYRPSTDRIVWLKTGPWLYQHDVNPLGEGRYSIFNNSVVPGTPDAVPDGLKSDIYIYDALTGEVDRPYSTILKEIGFFSKTEGRSRILGNGDLFAEETNHSRLFRVSREKVRWVFVNGLDEDAVGTVNWGRYLAPDEVDLGWLEE